jgi:hypothetical protein
MRCHPIEQLMCGAKVVMTVLFYSQIPGLVTYQVISRNIIGSCPKVEDGTYDARRCLLRHTLTYDDLLMFLVILINKTSLSG